MRLKFQDQDLQRQFVHEGFVLLPFLSSTEIGDLGRVFSGLHPGTLSPFYGTVAPTTDRRHRQAVFDAVRSIFEPRLAALFGGVEFCAASFFVKEALEPRSVVRMHVDPSFVDEREHDAGVCWCPLVDVNAENGCLTVVPGSLHHVGSLRPFGDATGSNPFQNVSSLLQKDYTRTIEMAAGDLIIFQPSLLHGSGPNMRPTRRVAVGAGIAPPGVRLQYSAMVSQTQAEVFEIGKEFYWAFQAGERPIGAKSLGIVGHRVDQLSEVDIRGSRHMRAGA